MSLEDEKDGVHVWRRSPEAGLLAGKRAATESEREGGNLAHNE